MLPSAWAVSIVRGTITPTVYSRMADRSKPATSARATSVVTILDRHGACAALRGRGVEVPTLPSAGQSEPVTYHPCFATQVASWAREWRSSLVKMLPRCTPTVPSVITRASAIWRSVSPWAASRATSRSRRVSGLGA